MDTTMNVQGRVDIRTLASIVKAYNARGFIVRSKSDVIWKVTEQIMSLLEREGEMRFELVTDAIDYLNRMGLYLETNSRARRQIAVALTNEDASLEDVDLPEQRMTVAKMTGRVRYDKGKSSRRSLYEAMVQVMRADGKEAMSFEEYNEKMDEKDRTATIGVETVNPVEFADKEAEKLRKLKEAMSSVPTATATATT